MNKKFTWLIKECKEVWYRLKVTCLKLYPKNKVRILATSMLILTISVLIFVLPIIFLMFTSCPVLLGYSMVLAKELKIIIPPIIAGIIVIKGWSVTSKKNRENNQLIEKTKEQYSYNSKVRDTITEFLGASSALNEFHKTFAVNTLDHPEYITKENNLKNDVIKTYWKCTLYQISVEKRKKTELDKNIKEEEQKREERKKQEARIESIQKKIMSLREMAGNPNKNEEIPKIDEIFSNSTNELDKFNIKLPENIDEEIASSFNLQFCMSHFAQEIYNDLIEYPSHYDYRNIQDNIIKLAKLTSLFTYRKYVDAKQELSNDDD